MNVASGALLAVGLALVGFARQVDTVDAVAWIATPLPWCEIACGL